MAAQMSNRGALLEGALRCIATMPLEQISARTLASESGANLASISYHFGSKDGLLTAAVVEGLDRWLAAIAARLGDVDATGAVSDRFLRAAAAVDETRFENAGVARAFVVALARAHHDEIVANVLIEGFSQTRPRVAALLGLGADELGADAGGLVHAMFTGLLVQSLISEKLDIEAERVVNGLRRVGDALSPPRV
jgi:AcrR family transcriptional regulator